MASKLYNTMYSCLIKKPVSEQTEVILDSSDIKEIDAPEMVSDKKTDTVVDPAQQPGMLWRLSSGVYNTTTGAVGATVGYGVGAIKWTASKGYDVTSTVAGKVKEKLPIPGFKAKDKKE